MLVNKCIYKKKYTYTHTYIHTHTHTHTHTQLVYIPSKVEVVSRTKCWNIMYVTVTLTHCRRLTQICVIAHPCVVNGPRISAFSYTTSNTHVFELV